MEYFLFLLFVFTLITIIKVKYNLKIYNNKKHMFLTIFLIFFTGSIWDYIATSRNHWVFPGPGLIGIKLFGLPIEEFMFFLIVPYFGFVLKEFIKSKT